MKQKVKCHFTVRRLQFWVTKGIPSLLVGLLHWYFICNYSSQNSKVFQNDPHTCSLIIYEGGDEREGGGKYNFISQHVNFMVLTVKPKRYGVTQSYYAKQLGEEFRRSSQLNEYQGSFSVVCLLPVIFFFSFNICFIRSPHY